MGSFVITETVNTFTFTIVSKTHGTFIVTAPLKWRTEIERHRWFVNRAPNAAPGRQFYVVAHVTQSGGKRPMLSLHRLIARLEGWDASLEVDHRDGQPLNNGLENLRPATHAENQHNKRRRRDNSSSAIGVCWHRTAGKWHAQIKINGRNRFLGYFDCIKDASRARDVAAFFLHGRFAQFNCLS